ncbi:MAG: manganese efflux pump [Desulfarculus sp.]|nr:MAG: manganese efflux pump [Desulfarculus sp.]
MPLLEVLALAVALGCDAFAVGLAVGAVHRAPRQVFRLSFHFGLFQFVMPLAGWWLGGRLSIFARDYAPWIAFALLLFIGGKMITDSLGPAQARAARLDPTKGWSLAALSLATSIDALGVGASLGLVGQEVLLPAMVIGVVAAGMTLAAMKLAGLLPSRLGRRLGLIGGLVLMGVALKLVLA